jgi:hypothetical protein
MSHNNRADAGKYFCAPTCNKHSTYTEILKRMMYMSWKEHTACSYILMRPNAKKDYAGKNQQQLFQPKEVS